MSRILDITAIQAERGRRSLKQFLMYAWPILEPGTPFIDGWVVDCLCDHMEALIRGEIMRLVINIQPRTLKSTLCSVAAPAWAWLQSPEYRFMSASYSLALSIRDNRRKRLLIESAWFQERWGTSFALSGDQNMKSFFENDRRGYHLATSVTGATTGQGADFLQIDDPHSASDAHSEADREAAVRWFREVWSSRLNNQATGRMLVVGQRVHETDVCGYILNERPDWIHLNLPAYYEPSRHCRTPIWSDPRSVENELLWPERFSHETLEGLRRDLGSIGFAAQYQQRPVPAGGSTFKKEWLRYFTETDTHYELERPEGPKRVLSEQCQKIITVDLAISQKQSADYTVFSTWAITPERELLLIDCLREHLDNPEQQKQLQLLHQRFHPSVILIENVAYQLALIQQLLRLGMPVREYKPVKDKVSRASTAAVFYEAGRIYHPQHTSWKQLWEDELLMFPMGAHDDMVDTVSMAADAIGGPNLTADDHLAALKRRLAARTTQQ